MDTEDWEGSLPANPEGSTMCDLLADLEKSTMSDDERRALEAILNTPTEDSTSVSIGSSGWKKGDIRSSGWREEDDRDNRSNPFLTSDDTDWIDTLYNTLYPLPGSKRHKETFFNIISNLSLRKSKISIQLHKSHYKGTYLPSYFLPSKVSEICNKLAKKGYIDMERGYKLEGKDGVATNIEPTDKLLSLTPSDMTYEIMEEGLVIPKEFSPDSFPPHIMEHKALLLEYNKTVEPENMLYATHKGSFDVDGRFTGSHVILMSGADRKSILIDGEATIELDVRSCLPFLLCASELGEELSIDAYDLPDVPRELAKSAFLKAVNCKNRETARRALQSEINLDYKSIGLNANEVLNRLEGAHPNLKEYLYTEVGRKLMNLESRCMATFMRSMLDKGIKFYPIYDSVRVPVSKREIVETELKNAFTIEGVEPVIHEDC